MVGRAIAAMSIAPAARPMASSHAQQAAATRMSTASRTACCGAVGRSAMADVPRAGATAGAMDQLDQAIGA